MTVDFSEPIASLDSDSFSLKPKYGLSHVIGEKTPALWKKTIPALLAETVDKFGSREALIVAGQNIRWTYRELAEKADSFAAGLLALGLGMGDRVGIWSPNRVEWIVLQYATARIGIILVNINPAYRLAEVKYALNKVECKAIMVASCFKASNYVEMMRSLAPELDISEPGKLKSESLPHLRIVIRMDSESTPGMYNYDDVMTLAGPAWHRQLDQITDSLDCDDAINIQFTSGTTGAPKGATLTHTNIVNNGRFTVERMNFCETDRLCIPVPLYHCFGMVMGSLGCVSKGAAMVFPGGSFEPVATLESVQKEKCSAIYGVPTMFVSMLEHEEFNRYNLESLRTGIMAGAPCPEELMKRVNSKMHMQEVTIAYGMTETSPVSFQSHTSDPFIRRVSTTGRIHPHVEAKVVDENGQTLTIDQKGELCTRGYSIMHGYWGDEIQTKEAIDSDGWMHTGDFAVIDAEGYCSIVGRVKDMVIRGGENIYPREIEEFLYRHPDIQDVQVFGVPDENFGEELCAWVIPKGDVLLTGDDIRAFCKGQIAHYKIPRYIRFKDSLPMTVTGKPQKFLMREEMISEIENT